MSAPQMLVADMRNHVPQASADTGRGTREQRLDSLGTVTDRQGNPVAGANVTLIDDNFRALATTTTDAQGDFRFIRRELSRVWLT